MFLSPWEPLGRRLRSIPIPQFRIQNPSSKYNFRSTPLYLESASYLHMRGIRVTIQRVSPAASQNKWAAPFALMRRTRT